MATWETRSLQGNVAVDAVANIQKVTDAVSAVSAIQAAGATIATAVIPTVASAALQVTRTAVTAGVDALLGPLGTGLYAAIVYPTKLDIQRIKVREEIAVADAEIERLRSQLSNPDFKLSMATIPNFESLDGDTIAAETAAMQGNNTIFDRISDLISARFQLIELERRMEDPGFQLSYSYSDFVNSVELSFSDPLDPRRPKFGDATIVGGGVVLIYADKIADFHQALANFLTFFKKPKLARRAEAISKFLTGRKALVKSTRQGIGQQPDWWSWTIARLLGIEEEIDKMRLAAYAIGGSATINEKVATFLAEMESVITNASGAITAFSSLFSTLASADVGVAVLPIPPIDGERQVNVAGRRFTIPNATYGTEGFVRVMREATGAPTANYVAGLVILVPEAVPGLLALLGISEVSSIDTQTILGKLLTEGQVDSVILLIRNTADLIGVKLNAIRALTNAV